MNKEVNVTLKYVIYYFILLTVFVKGEVYISGPPNGIAKIMTSFHSFSPVCHWLVQQIAPAQTHIIGWDQTNREMFWKIEPYSHSVNTF